MATSSPYTIRMPIPQATKPRGTPSQATDSVTVGPSGDLAEHFRHLDRAGGPGREETPEEGRQCADRRPPPQGVVGDAELAEESDHQRNAAQHLVDHEPRGERRDGPTQRADQK